MSWHALSCLSLKTLFLASVPFALRLVQGVGSVAPLAEENQPQGGERVERDPEACDDFVFQTDWSRFNGRWFLKGGQLFQFEFVRPPRVDIVDETVGGRTFFYCGRLSVGAHTP